MSRLSDLIHQAKRENPQLGAEIEKEVRHLQERRAFGLNFERHQPEAVDLYGRPVRRGDKVRMLPPRGETTSPDTRLWIVTGAKDVDGRRTTELKDRRTGQTAEYPIDDLVVVAESNDTIYPGLVSTGKVERGGDKPFHTVINAENLHALKALLYTHRGRIDVVYIDPPYNTGARDWKYSNDYVESDDLYRHSKWLAFMERRLLVAKELLNPDDSVLIVTIDEKEVARLRLLLEQLFSGSRLQMISTIINPQGISSGTGEFSRVDEYIFFVSIGAAKISQWSRSMVENDKEANDVSDDRSVRWADFARYGGNASRKSSPGAFFPVFIDIETETVHSVGDAIDWDVDPAEVATPVGTRAIWPARRPDGSDGRWRVVAESCRELVELGYLKVGPFIQRSNRHSLSYLQGGTIAKIRNGEIVVTGRDAKGSALVEYAASTKTATPKTIWTLSAHDASRHGANLLSQFLPGRRFPYPKSLYAVEDAIRFYVSAKPTATIVDFFAGSGTTTHAIMRLNRQDGGRRQSISVTNNEVSSDEGRVLGSRGLRPGDSEWEAFGICEFITKPRIVAAVTGLSPSGEAIKGTYRFVDEVPMSDGLEENAEFYTLTYEAPLNVATNHEFERIAPLLWLRAGSQGRRIEKLRNGWDVAAAYGVLADLDRLGDFLAALIETPTARLAFVVTDDERQFTSVCSALPDHVEPVRLYESYLRNFQIDAARSGR